MQSLGFQRRWMWLRRDFRDVHPSYEGPGTQLSTTTLSLRASWELPTIFSFRYQRTVHEGFGKGQGLYTKRALSLYTQCSLSINTVIFFFASGIGLAAWRWNGRVVDWVGCNWSTKYYLRPFPISINGYWLAQAHPGCKDPCKLCFAVKPGMYAATCHSVEPTILSECNPRKTKKHQHCNSGCFGWCCSVPVLLTSDEGRNWQKNRKWQKFRKRSSLSRGTCQNKWLSAPPVHVTRDCKVAFMMSMDKHQITWNRPSVTPLPIGIGFVSFRRSQFYQTWWINRTEGTLCFTYWIAVMFIYSH